MQSLGRADILRWRKAERERLIAERLAMTVEERRSLSRRIVERLEEAIGDVRGLVVSGYSPFRGEPALHELIKGIASRGGSTALPVVLARGEPLQFRSWAPGEPTEKGVWSIPIPTARAAVVVPDVIIAPVVGFDRDGFRLGYGGGFYDRTLAALARRPRVFGVGYAQAEIPTIHPLPHDIAMDAIVTERDLVRPGAEGSRGNPPAR